MANIHKYGFKYGKCNSVQWYSNGLHGLHARHISTAGHSTPHHSTAQHRTPTPTMHRHTRKMAYTTLQQNTTSTSVAMNAMAMVLLNDDADTEEHFAALYMFAAWRRTVRQRHVLRKRDLMPDPTTAPGIHLLKVKSRGAFISCMSIDPFTFYNILLPPFKQLYDRYPIPFTIEECELTLQDIRHSSHPAKKPRLAKRSTTAEIALAVVLHYLNSSSREKTLQLIFAMVPAVLNRTIHWGLFLLEYITSQIPECAVEYPNPDQMQQYSDMICTREPRLHGAFGFADGLNIPTGTSSDPIWENCQYNG